jgi:predicted Zn-ribbon and HTH transcriptional regulator
MAGFKEFNPSQVTVAPRCPKCKSGNTICRRSMKIRDGVEYEDQTCNAQMQYRECRDCGKLFAVTKIGSPKQTPPDRRTAGWRTPGR